MTLKIISAEDILFQGETSLVRLPGTLGAFTVLPGHATLISTLTPGKVEYITSDGPQAVEIAGGVADVEHNTVSVCIY